MELAGKSHCSRRAHLLDEINKRCEINTNGEISVKSLLQYVKEEIEVSFIDSHCVINKLITLLREESQSGWLPIDTIHNIFVSWLNQPCQELQFKITKPEMKYSDNTDSTPFQSNPLASSTPYSLRERLLNGSHGNYLKYTTFCIVCEGCGKDGRCCELPSDNESGNRDEKLSKHFEQRILDLKTLLNQSEEEYTALQNEYENLKSNYRCLENEEKYWHETEMEWKEREQQLMVLNSLASEQKTATDAEVQGLRHHLSRSKAEYETLLSEYVILEKNKAKWGTDRKLLVDAKRELAQFENELTDKVFCIKEKEERICELLEINEKYRHTIDAHEKCTHPEDEVPVNDILISSPEGFNSPFTDRHLSRLSLEMSISKTSSLKAELEAADKINSSFEDVSTQTISLVMIEKAIQMDSPLITTCKNVSIQTSCFTIHKAAQTVSSTTKLSRLTSTFTQTNDLNSCEHCKEFSDRLCERKGPNTSKTYFKYCSTFEMEVITTREASTQIDSSFNKEQLKVSEKEIQTEVCSYGSSKDLVLALNPSGPCRHFSTKPSVSTAVSNNIYSQWLLMSGRKKIYEKQQRHIQRHVSLCEDMKQQRKKMGTITGKISLRPSILKLPSKPGALETNTDAVFHGHDPISPDNGGNNLESKPTSHLEQSFLKKKFRVTSERTQRRSNGNGVNGFGVIDNNHVVTFIPNVSSENIVHSTQSVTHISCDATTVSETAETLIPRKKMCKEAVFNKCCFVSNNMNSLRNSSVEPVTSSDGDYDSPQIFKNTTLVKTEQEGRIKISYTYLQLFNGKIKFFDCNSVTENQRLFQQPRILFPILFLLFLFCVVSVLFKGT